MSLRELALLMVVVLTVPASIALLRPRHRAGAAGATTPRRALDALWVVVPAVLLVALATLSIIA
jgi:heme/copper-type cytochrome/quinol oxidase subunit 2